MTCVPAVREKPEDVTVCQFCHPPVPGMAIEPVALTPSNSTWKRPPLARAANLASSRYVPAVATLIV